MLDIVASYHCMKFHRKLKNQTSENGKKPSFGPDFGPFWPKFGLPKLFFKNLALSFTRCHVQLPSCTISEKTNDPILRKLSDRRTDGQE